MRRPVTLTYRLTEDLWRQFYEAHYAADHALRIRYVWGAACIIIGSLGFGGLFDNRIVAALLLAAGFYFVLSRPIFVLKSVAAARKHPYFRKEITVVVADDGIAVRSGNAGDKKSWRDFTGCREVKPGFILYFSKTAFFFIPRSACAADDERRIQRLLASVQWGNKG